MRRAQSLVTFGLPLACLFAWSVAAKAEPAPSPNCPPGSWFCADAQVQAAAPAGEPLQPALPPSAASSDDPASGAPHAGAPPPPPPYIYETPPPYGYTPRPPASEGFGRGSAWGLVTRIEGALLGSRASGDAGMAGIGVGGRYKPIPHLGIDGALDFLGGRDFYGRRRGESALSFSALYFVNPRSMAQLYFLTGIGWSAAHVVDDSPYYSRSLDYTYMGMQFGVGGEFHLSRHVALDLDLRGFVRGRLDRGAAARPEFIDASGRTSNTSGGGLLSAGMTFYF